MKLSEKWPWDKFFLWQYITLPLLFSALLIYKFFPAYGYYSLLTLLSMPVGLFLYFRYTSIHHKVNTLLGCKSALNGEAVAAQLLINNQLSPGIAILRETVIILIPINGRRRKLQLSDINKTLELDVIANKHLISKSIISMETKKNSQYTFAIPRSTGNRWFKKLSDATGNTI